MPDRTLPNETLTLREFFAFARGSAPYALAFGVAAAGITGYLVSQVPRTYTATAQVLHDPGASHIVVQDTFRRETGAEVSRVESQIQVLRSARVSMAVIARLDLLSDPDFQRVSREGVLSRVLSLVGFEKEAQEVGASVGEDQGDASSAGDFLGRADVRYAIAALQERMSVRRVGQSFILEIAYRSRFPRRAAEIANAIGEAYVAEDIRAKSDAARRSAEWLQERSDDLRQRAFSAMRAYELFRSSGSPGQLSDARVQAAELESVSQASRRVYETFLQRLGEMAQFASLPMADARVVATATAPLTHSDPKVTLSAVFAGLVGSGFGVVVSFLGATFNRWVRSRKHIEALGVPLLGVVRRVRKLEGSGAGVGSENGRQAGNASDRLSLEGADCRYIADIRRLRIVIHYEISSGGNLCIGVAAVGDGGVPARFVQQLVALSSTAGDRTLLVDGCTMEDGPSVGLVSDRTTGLMEALDHPEAISDFVRQGGTPNLYVLPPGQAAGAISAADRLDPKALPRLLNVCRDQYVMTVFALPAIPALPDGRAIGPLLDGIVLIVRYGRTKIADVEAALVELRRTSARIVGVVIEDVPSGVGFD